MSQAYFFSGQQLPPPNVAGSFLVSDGLAWRAGAYLAGYDTTNGMLMQTVPAGPTGFRTLVQFQGAHDTAATPRASVDLRGAGTNITTPSVILNGHTIGTVDYRPYRGSAGPVLTANVGCRIEARMEEDASLASTMCGLRFWTCRTGSNSGLDSWRISGSGVFLPSGITTSDIGISGLAASQPRTIYVNTSFVVGSSQVVAARRTGWTAWTGTAARGTQNADGPATALQIGQALKALIDDLLAHGLIGA